MDDDKMCKYCRIREAVFRGYCNSCGDVDNRLECIEENCTKKLDPHNTCYCSEHEKPILEEIAKKEYETKKSEMSRVNDEDIERGK
ncbi:MAG: hypothetical protein ACREAK_00700 [Nitrosarchaeum sp.]